MDYAALRAEGIEHLERLAGTTWTDFNAHDPGITILEQVAYALSDLAYRAGFAVPDLLASDGADPYASLPGPHDVLPTYPVTAVDLRKLVLDVPGVKNAWVEPATDEHFALHYHPGRRELSMEADPPASEPVALAGLHRVLVEAADPDAATAVLAAVARRLYRHRALCEDFAEIRLLQYQPVQVDAAIEIGQVEDAHTVLLAILDALAAEIAPWIPFVSYEQALRQGVPVDEIFDGPLLRRGYLDPVVLAASRRRTAIRVSDLVNAIMGVPGVRAITRITVAAGGTPEPWSVDLDPNKGPQLDLGGSSVTLTRGAITAGVGIADVADRYVALQAARRAAAAGGPAPTYPFAPPAGRDRSVGRYHSLQYQFPDLYGIADVGLPESASAARRARAAQLKAYLLFFDQVLANEFAQLAHVADLFSFNGASTATYFTQAVADPELDLDAVRSTGLAEHEERLAAMADPGETADPAADLLALGRKNRFLSHLLARFAEQFADYSLALSGARTEVSELERELIADKQAFLLNYPAISAGRGGAGDDLLPAPDPTAALAGRIRLKLGLTPGRGEDLLVVEHILLRPVDADRQQAIPMVTDTDLRDPYSHRVSFVFLQRTVGRMASARFRDFVHQTVREETPAHLVTHIHWLAPQAFAAFKEVYAEWRAQRRADVAARFGIELVDAEA